MPCRAVCYDFRQMAKKKNRRGRNSKGEPLPKKQEPKASPSFEPWGRRTFIATIVLGVLAWLFPQPVSLVLFEVHDVATVKDVTLTAGTPAIHVTAPTATLHATGTPVSHLIGPSATLQATATTANASHTNASRSIR
jgi:hypothetical protein